MFLLSRVSAENSLKTLEEGNKGGTSETEEMTEHLNGLRLTHMCDYGVLIVRHE